MEWTASPSGSVWRKRLHLVGPAESGQVTSIVRYDRNAEFPVHDHPDGEEILVLDGVFSDQEGDWPAGTYLLNPQGFRHAPFSRDGCVLFVKLRQFPGNDREHVALDTNQIPWEAGALAGIWRKRLYTQTGYADVTELQKWDTAPGPLTYTDGAEIFVLEGGFEDENGSYGAGYWLRLPAGSVHHPAPQKSCTLYLKRGGFRYLQAAAG